MKDLGALRFFVGLEVSSSKQGILLNQHKYTLELLEDSASLAVKPASTPCDPSCKLSSEGGNHFLIGRHFILLPQGA